MKPIRIQVFEHTTLKVDTNGLTERHFEQLVRYNERNGNQCFEVGHLRLYFKSFVGVIQVGQLTIEILPKADKHEEEGRTKWRDALLRMLRVCHHIRLESSGLAKLKLRNDSLVDLYFETYLFECHKLMREGLRKSYCPKEGNRTNLKGRLLFGEQIKRNLIHKERFYTRYVEYNRSSLHNQVLHRALTILKDIASPHIAAKAQSLLLELEDIVPARITAMTFNRLTFDRNTNRYREAIQLARLIILNYAPDLKSGSDDVIAILFDMNQLFEEYVFRCLKRASRELPGINISSQKSKVFWTSERTRKTIRPDILIEIEEKGIKRRTVVDTKWKVPLNNLPDDADLKQMYAYNLQFEAAESVLLYPIHKYSQSSRGAFTNLDSSGRGDHESHTSLEFVELFNESGELDSRIWIKLLLKLGLYSTDVGNKLHTAH